MIFLQKAILLYVAIGVFIILASGIFVENKFFKWVEAYWFVRRSYWHRLGSLLFAAGIILLSVILLDPRSGETRIKGKVKQDRTIILIDTSTSMLAEDVRPNRLEKAIMVAKHFVRKAVGHQISVMVFADISKKLVPFTSDVDLLDARIDSIKTLRNLNAGSSIGLAIEEAVQYFDVKDKSVSGNIIVITDGEDNADTESFKVPENISLALVGVGTREGGPIPMKDSMGFHHGNKRQGAVTVITKLNESFFKNAVSQVKSGKYYIVRSYDLPTEDILEFLNQRKTAEKDGENMIRPVAIEFWAVPGLILVALGLVLRSIRPFTVAALVCFISLGAHAQEKELPPDILQRLDQLREGKLDRRERINLADQLSKVKSHKLAQEIYQENLDGESIEGNEESFFNRATSELESGNMSAALKHYDQLERHLGKSNPRSPMIEQIRQNIRRAVMPQEQQKKQKQDDQKKSDNKDQQGQDSKPQSSDGKGEGKPQTGEQGSEQDKNPFDPKNKDQPNDGQDKKEQEKGDQKDEEKNDQPSEEDDRANEKRPRPKPSPLLEQLKQEDRKLQNKLLDVSTQKRKQGRKKDW